MKAPILCLLTMLALLPRLALADSPQVYKWTDAAGIIHYSDKPPAQAVADVQTLDLPALPPQDPVELAARQTALLTQIETLRKLEAGADQQSRVAELERKQAELEAELAAVQQAQSEPVVEPLIYTSAFVPAAYRRNLYVSHRHHDRDSDRDDRPPRSPPEMPVMPLKPRP